MFAEERKREILRILSQQKKVKTLELSQMFSVSEPTIRRDINELEEQGLLIRTHGGAIALDHSEIEPSYYEKKDRYSTEKQEIGELSAGLIKDYDTVILDSGTTTLEIAKAITAKHITVLTNSLDIAAALEDKADVEIVVLGGVMRWNTRALVGPIPEKVLDSFRVNIAFVGTNGFNESGFMTPNQVEAQTKRKMIEVADRAFVVADSSKYGKTQLCVIAKLSEVNGVISDHLLNESFIAHCEKEEINVILKVGEGIDRNRNAESRH